MQRCYLRGNPVRLLMYDGHMETVEKICGSIGAHWIGLLDFVTKLQKYTSLAYSCSASECTKRYIVVAGGMNYVKI